MIRFFAPADRAVDWQQLLAKPNLHWKTGYSAKSLAYSWTEARGFPLEVDQVLNSSNQPPLSNLEFLLGFPEYEVSLPGGKRASQNDIFVLARGSQGLVTIMVEGKMSEPFDLPVRERLSEPTTGQLERLAYLCDFLGLDEESVSDIGYQLLHRSASALIEAKRFGAKHALMLVHSFSQSLDNFEDYASFAGLFDIDVEPNQVSFADKLKGVFFYLGWVVGNPEYLTR